MFKTLGNCRVVSVVIDEDGVPAIELRSCDESGDSIDYYYTDELSISDPVEIAA